MWAYLNLVREVLRFGKPRTDRTGTGARALFGRQLRFDVAEAFPILTTKRIHFHSVKHELLWFLSGQTNIAYLHRNKVHIWDEWADENGDLGPVYGRQWRSWPAADGRSIDQLEILLRQIKAEPSSRRMILSSWNVAELDLMKLQPCHVLMQAWVDQGKLSLQVYQRSADLFLGLPFNIASYALLLAMMAQVCSLAVGDLVHVLGDVHLYDNHIAQAEQQLAREPRAPPKLALNPSISDIRNFGASDIRLLAYRPHPTIKAPVAV